MSTVRFFGLILPRVFQQLLHVCSRRLLEVQPTVFHLLRLGKYMHQLPHGLSTRLRCRYVYCRLRKIRILGHGFRRMHVVSLSLRFLRLERPICLPHLHHWFLQGYRRKVQAMRQQVLELYRSWHRKMPEVLLWFQDYFWRLSKGVRNWILPRSRYPRLCGLQPLLPRLYWSN